MLKTKSIIINLPNPLWTRYMDGLYLMEYTPEILREIGDLKRELSSNGEVVDVRIKPMDQAYITATMAGLVSIRNHSNITLKVIVWYETNE